MKYRGRFKGLINRKVHIELLSEGTTRSTNDQFCLHDHAASGHNAVLDQIDQNLNGFKAELVYLLTDGSQLRVGHFGLGDIIKTDKRNVIWDIEPGITHSTHSTESH